MKTIIIAFLMLFALNKVSAQQISAVEMQVTGLTCSMCSQATEKSLRTLSYVSNVNPDLNKNLFVLTFKKEGAVSLDQLQKKVKDAGFSVGNLAATINFNQAKVDEDGQVVVGGNVYRFANVKGKVLNGPVKVNVIDKNFISNAAFKKKAAQLKFDSYATGMGTVNGKKNQNLSFKHLSMIKKTIGLILLGFCLNMSLSAQELYVFTEPASNMPAKSIGLRLTNEGMFSPDFRSRSIAEVMVGVNKNLMFHVQGFFSDMDGKYRAEGSSLYVKYRFLSLDAAQSHFRAAAFARISSSKRKVASEDINLEGDNSGIQGGFIFTQLIHKLALSATLGYSKSLRKEERMLYVGMDMHGMPGMNMPSMGTKIPDELLSYSLSSGYLLLPFVYKNYNQPNFNLYFEVLGKTNPVNGHSYVDFAPAAQLILNSKTRIDLGYRFQAAGNMEGRYLKNMYLARVEFNFFNALSKKQD